MTKAQLIERFGEVTAQDIMDRKLADETLKLKETRWHPELPGNEDSHMIEVPVCM